MKFCHRPKYLHVRNKLYFRPKDRHLEGSFFQVVVVLQHHSYAANKVFPADPLCAVGICLLKQGLYFIVRKLSTNGLLYHFAELALGQTFVLSSPRLHEKLVGLLQSVEVEVNETFKLGQGKRRTTGWFRVFWMHGGRFRETASSTWHYGWTIFQCQLQWLSETEGWGIQMLSVAEPEPEPS